MVRVGYDEHIKKFTYIKFSTALNTKIEMGQLTPTTEVVPVYFPGT